MRNDYQNEMEKIHAPESLKEAVKARMREEEKLIREDSVKRYRKNTVQRCFPIMGAAAAVFFCVWAGGQFFSVSGGSTGSYSIADKTAEGIMMAEAAAAPEEAEGAAMAGEGAGAEEKAAERESMMIEEAAGESVAPGLLAGETGHSEKIITLEEFDAVFGTRFMELEGSSVVAYVKEGEQPTGSVLFSYRKEGNLFSVEYSVGEQMARNIEAEEERTIAGQKVGFCQRAGWAYALWSERKSSLVIFWEAAEVTDDALIEAVVREVLGKM